MNGIGAGLVEGLAGLDVPVDFIGGQGLQQDLGLTVSAKRRSSDRRQMRSRCAPRGCGRSSAAACSGFVSEAGLPRMRPSIETIVSAPMTQLCGNFREISSALASASVLTYSGGEASGTLRSSKVPAMTVNASPACFSRQRRRGDPEARIKGGSVSFLDMRSLLTNADGFDNDANIRKRLQRFGSVLAKRSNGYGLL